MVLSLCVVFALGFSSCGKTPYSDVKLSDYIKMGDYKGLSVMAQPISVTDEEVDLEIENRLKAQSTTEEIKEGEVKDGDTAIITYEGTIDGKPFDGGSAEGYSLTIGSGQFIDGFESGLVGVKVGESKTLKLKFPENYGKEDLPLCLYFRISAIRRI